MTILNQRSNINHTTVSSEWRQSSIPSPADDQVWILSKCCRMIASTESEESCLITNGTSGANNKNNDVSICNNDGAGCTLNAIQALIIDNSWPISPAHKFDLYGWKLDLWLPNDELYLDVAFLITQKTQEDGRQSHIGALIVQPEKTLSSDICVECTPNRKNSTVGKEEDDNNVSPAFDKRHFFNDIVGAGTNKPLFGSNESTSDIHAKINAPGEACKSLQSTENCTVYITIPPCKRCFAALVTIGIWRIVTWQTSPISSAKRHRNAVLRSNTWLRMKNDNKCNKSIN